MKKIKSILCTIASILMAVTCFSFASCDMLQGFVGETNGSSSTYDEDDWFDDDLFDDYFDDEDDDDFEDSTPAETYDAGTIRFEAEKAEFYSPGSNALMRIESTELASGGACVAYFRDTGNTITFTITSNKAEANVPITICGASAVEIHDAAGNQVGLEARSADIIASLFANNGTGMRDASGIFNGSGTGDANYGFSWYNFGSVTGYIDLVEGENVVTLTCVGDALNIDYIEFVTQSASLSWTPSFNY